MKPNVECKKQKARYLVLKIKKAKLLTTTFSYNSTCHSFYGVLLSASDAATVLTVFINHLFLEDKSTADDFRVYILNILPTRYTCRSPVDSSLI
jgi:hypothetical protein